LKEAYDILNAIDDDSTQSDDLIALIEEKKAPDRTSALARKAKTSGMSCQRDQLFSIVSEFVDTGHLSCEHLKNLSSIAGRIPLPLRVAYFTNRTQAT
jgi:hypothetical protein